MIYLKEKLYITLFTSTSNDEDSFYFPAIQKHKSLYGTEILGEKYIY